MVFEPALDLDSFYNSRLIGDLADLAEKVFTRDLFGRTDRPARGQGGGTNTSYNAIGTP